MFYYFFLLFGKENTGWRWTSNSKRDGGQSTYFRRNQKSGKIGGPTSNEYYVTIRISIKSIVIII